MTVEPFFGARCIKHYTRSKFRRVGCQ